MRRTSLQLWARLRPLAFLVVMVLPSSALAGNPTCVPFSEAEKYVGSHRCVIGKVVQVETGEKGVHFVDFCTDHGRCPFSVVVFASDLKHVGDIRDLTGREIQICGDIREYDGHAEIILERVGQLVGDAARIPPLPKDYDVERRGHYSSGQFSRPKATKSPKQKKAKPPPSVIWDTEQNQDPE
jgi:hypothetical protein